MQRRLGATVDQVDTDGGARQSAEVMVSYSDRTWTVTDENKTWSFTPALGGRIEHSTGEVEQAPRDRDDYLPPEVALSSRCPCASGAASRTTSGWRELKWKVKEPGLPWFPSKTFRFTGSAFVNTRCGVIDRVRDACADVSCPRPQLAPAP